MKYISAQKMERGVYNEMLMRRTNKKLSFPFTKCREPMKKKNRPFRSLFLHYIRCYFRNILFPIQGWQCLVYGEWIPIAETCNSKISQLKAIGCKCCINPIIN